MAVRTASRRDAILAAALDCFTEMGYDGASITRICQGSGASVGSIYHHFGDKEGVAAALYVEGIRRYQAGLVQIVEFEPEPGPGVAEMVDHHLDWVRDNPDWARFLFGFGTAPLGALERASIREANTRLLDLLRTWIARHAAAGRLASLEPGVFLAVTLGPCHELVRRWLGGDAAFDLAQLAPDLRAAACRAAGAVPNQGGS